VVLWICGAGARILLTPESSVDAQKAYKSDIIIPLDELPPYHITPELLEKSVYLSHR
jgi:queuine tRNA-ribosyltransferase